MLQRRQSTFSMRDSMIEGVIIKKIADFFYVAAGGEIYTAKARGILKGKGRIVTGDRIMISLNGDSDGTAAINKVLKRKNSLERPAVANVDMALLVVPVQSPPINTYIIDSFLVSLAHSNIDSVICFSKIDLDEIGEYKKTLEAYKNIGYMTAEISNVTGHGVNYVKELLNGKITALCGASGAGKSSLLNSIKSDLNLDTNQISERLQRGKNTTTYADLIKLNQDTYAVDTPGFTSFSLKGVKKEDLRFLFPEFDKYYKNCKFRGCLHNKEPGCMVKQAVNDGYIENFRYENYLKLLLEL